LLDMSAMYLLMLRPLVRFRLVTYLHGAKCATCRAARARFTSSSRAVSPRATPSLRSRRVSPRMPCTRTPVVRDKIHVIPNGIDVERLAAAPAAVRARPYVLYVGRLAREKNVATILEAYARAAVARPRSRSRGRRGRSGA
jgi:glycosyltransferase involved in cell wall biosynthesis